MSIHTLEIEYEEFDSPDALPEDERDLVALAWAARKMPMLHIRILE